jgi:hypothetical protein
MDVAIAIIGTLAAVGAAIAAFGSWKAATRANLAAAAMAAIERERRHDELAPIFDVTCKMRSTAPDSAYMRVTLAAGGMDRLDEVTVTILDDSDQDHWGRGLPITARDTAWIC